MINTFYCNFKIASMNFKDNSGCELQLMCSQTRLRGAAAPLDITYTNNTLNSIEDILKLNQFYKMLSQI